MEKNFSDGGLGDVETIAREIEAGRGRSPGISDDGSAGPVESLETISASELSRKTLAPVSFAIDDMFPTGLSIVASAPKIGKSWFILDACLSVARGAKFLGRRTIKSEALYLSLEDSENRLKDRISKILKGEEVPEGLYLSTHASDLDHGLIESLEGFVKEHKNVQIIAIDTFAKIRGEMRRSEGAYASDYREAGALKTFADSHKIALILIHHTRKARDYTDSFNNISGTNGLFGACDASLVLEKEKRTDETTKLSITGRDASPQELEMEFKDFQWRVLGTSEEVEERRVREEYDRSPVVQSIKKALKLNDGQWTGTASELISASKYYKTQIFGSATNVGREIEKLSSELYEYDKIIYEPIKNGSGGRKHKFYYTE